MNTRPTTDHLAAALPAGKPDFVYLNGIDPETGMYAVQPVPIEELAEGVRRSFSAPSGAALRGDPVRSFAAPYGIHLERTEDAGWAVVFSEGAADEVREALEPLVEHRLAQAGPLLRVLDYRKGERIHDWYFRHRVAPGELSPEQVPYYLLLVGPPAEIPFDFQCALSEDYAVGRLAFDRAADYERYARSVVAYETGGAISNAKQIVYWGTCHPGDPATGLSASYLIDALADGVEGARGAEGRAIHARVGYERKLYRGQDATREQLLAALRGPRAPAVLFAASHGMAVRSGRPNQAADQGGLLCQDWPGSGGVHREHYLTAEDVADDANVSGLVAILFASFGAGTPATDQFLTGFSKVDTPAPLAERPFLAALPSRLLSHPAGSALAVVGQADRAWGFSVQPPKATDPQTGVFRNSLGYILDGTPVGHVVAQQFGQRSAALSAALLGAVSPTAPASVRPSDRDLVGYWLERNDARGCVLLGDPAVRIRKDHFARAPVPARASQ